MIKFLFEQQSEAWHEARVGRVTGTRFKELMSGKSTKGYNDLILEIAGEIITGTSPDEDSYSNTAMERGIELEPEAANYYTEITGIELEKCGFIIPDEGHNYHDWIGISPDRLHPDNGLVEIKCPYRNTHIKYLFSNTMPSEYKYQVQGQLFVSGLDFCDFVSYYPGMKLFVYRVYPDAEIFASFETELNEMIKRVKEVIDNYNNIDV